MNRAAIGWVVGMVFVCQIGAGAQGKGGGAATKSATNPVKPTTASITAGKALFAKHCESCHGTAGKGDGRFAPKNSPPADLTDAEWKRGSADGDIFTVVRDGAVPELIMRGFKGRMTDTEIWNVVNYVRTLAPKGSR